jgi:hypothetical protein
VQLNNNYVFNDLAGQAGLPVDSLIDTTSKFTKSEESSINSVPIESSEADLDDLDFFEGIPDVISVSNDVSKHLDIPFEELEASTLFMREKKEGEINCRDQLTNEFSKVEGILYKSDLASLAHNNSVIFKELATILLNLDKQSAVNISNDTDTQKVSLQIIKYYIALKAKTNPDYQDLFEAYQKAESLGTNTLLMFIDTIPELSNINYNLLTQLPETMQAVSNLKQSMKGYVAVSNPKNSLLKSMQDDLDILSDTHERYTTTFPASLNYDETGLKSITCGNCGETFGKFKEPFSVNMLFNKYVSNQVEITGPLSFLSVTFSPNICPKCKARIILSRVAGSSITNSIVSRMRSGAFLSNNTNGYNLDTLIISPEEIKEIFESASLDPSVETDSAAYLFPEINIESNSNILYVPKFEDVEKHLDQFTAHYATGLDNLRKTYTIEHSTYLRNVSYLRWLITNLSWGVNDSLKDRSGYPDSLSPEYVIDSLIQNVFDNHPDVMDLAKQYNIMRKHTLLMSVYDYCQNNKGVSLYKDFILSPDYIEKVKQAIDNMEFIGGSYASYAPTIIGYFNDGFQTLSTVNTIDANKVTEFKNLFPMSLFDLKQMYIDALYIYASEFIEVSRYAGSFFGFEAVRQSVILGKRKPENMSVLISGDGVSYFVLRDDFYRSLHDAQSDLACISGLCRNIENIDDNNEFMHLVKVPFEQLNQFYTVINFDDRQFISELIKIVPCVIPGSYPVIETICNDTSKIPNIQSYVNDILDADDGSGELSQQGLDSGSIAIIIAQSLITLLPGNIKNEYPEFITSLESYLKEQSE